MRKLQYERCINGGKLLSVQLCHNAFQRCFCDLVAACHGGGPSLTDERPNLLISPTSVEVVWKGGGVFGGLYDKPNGSTRCLLTVANKIKEPVCARVRRKMREEIRDR